MDIRRPKPIHGWRDFLVEIGTIVIGISIALAAEQTLEAMHGGHRIREIEGLMTRELALDDGPQAYERLAISACLAQRLDQLEAGLVAERESGVPFRPGAPYQPPFHTWDEDGWRAAESSDIASRMSIARLAQWAGPYEEIPSMDRAGFEEFRDGAALGDLKTAQAHPSAAERDSMLELIRRLRGDNLFLTRSSGVLLRDIADAGVAIPAELAQQVVSSMRAAYGPCVVAPAVSGPAASGAALD